MFPQVFSVFVYQNSFAFFVWLGMGDYQRRRVFILVVLSKSTFSASKNQITNEHVKVSFL